MGSSPDLRAFDADPGFFGFSNLVYNVGRSPASSAFLCKLFKMY